MITQNSIMHKIAIMTILCSFSFNTYSQKVNLSEYCPNEKSQYKATCYSYAVVYTAMSTEYNIKNNKTDYDEINKDYFSPGVVASYHNSSLSIHKRSPKCGRYGTANKALNILKNTGTTLSSQYNCDCKRYNKIIREIKPSEKFYKITDYNKLEINNQFSEDNVNWIKQALNNQHPVIIGVYQNSQLKGVKSDRISDSIPDAETMLTISKNLRKGISNHVVCILGYDDNFENGKGYFLIKNNYTNWGENNGFSWIPYTFIIPLINEAYYISGIE